jgi:hypothetical protein
MAYEEPEFDEDEREEGEGAEPSEGDGGETEAAREAREDAEEAAHEARRGTRGEAGEGASPAPASNAAAPGSPESNPFWSVLPAAYQQAVKSGTVTVEAALSRHMENQRQHLSRIHGNNERLQREIEATRQAAEQGGAKTAARLDRLLGALGVADPVAATGQIPAAEDDLAGHLVGRLGQIEGRLEAGQQEAARAAEEMQQRVYVEREADAIEAYSAAHYEATVQQFPDYDQAEAFLVNRAFSAELMRLTDQFPGATQEQLRQAAAQSILATSAELQRQARRNGTSLPAAVYNAARQNGWGGQQQVQQQQPARPTPAQQRMAAQRELRGASQTIAGTAPRVAPPSETQLLDEILNFTDEEFEELFEGDDNRAAEKHFRALLQPYSHPG